VSGNAQRGEVVYVRREGLPTYAGGDTDRRWVVVQSDVFHQSVQTIVVKITSTPQHSLKGVQIPDGEAGLKNSWVDCNTIATVRHEFIDRDKKRPHLRDLTTMNKVARALRYVLDMQCGDEE